MGDNGKSNDNMHMHHHLHVHVHVLSPYPAHRNTVTECPKLLVSGFEHCKAIVVFGYDRDTLLMARRSKRSKHSPAERPD